MDAREKRLAQNESLFREINERVRELAVTHGPDEHVYTFFCECSNTDCTLQVELTTAAYEAVRARVGEEAARDLFGAAALQRLEPLAA